MTRFASDPGVVVWAATDARWWSICQAPGRDAPRCAWKASHDDADTAVAAMHRHLVAHHVLRGVDARSEPE